MSVESERTFQEVTVSENNVLRVELSKMAKLLQHALRSAHGYQLSDYIDELQKTVFSLAELSKRY